MAKVLYKERIWPVPDQDTTSYPESSSLPLARTSAVEQTRLSKRHLLNIRVRQELYDWRPDTFDFSFDWLNFYILKVSTTLFTCLSTT